MRALIIQEAGRHLQNSNFRECMSLKRAFEYNGHLCDVWGLGHMNHSNDINFNLYDIILNCENYDTTNWVPKLNKIKGPIKILWSIDAHFRGEDIYNEIFQSNGYDILLHSTKQFVKKDFHIWFPNCFDDDLIKPLGLEKIHFLGFCGNYANRKEIIDFLSNKYGMKTDIFVIGDSMVKAINSYKVHFNKNIGIDINYRSFETIGAGTLLLTNYNEVYDELGFINMDNYIFYKDQKDLENTIDSIKKDPDLIKKISDKGQALSKNHTYKVRVKNMIDYLWKK